MPDRAINNIRVFRAEFADGGSARRGAAYRSSILMTIKGLYLTAKSGGDYTLCLLLENSGVRKTGEPSNRQSRLEIGEIGNRHGVLRLNGQKKSGKRDEVPVLARNGIGGR